MTPERWSEIQAQDAGAWRDGYDPVMVAELVAEVERLKELARNSSDFTAMVEQAMETIPEGTWIRLSISSGSAAVFFGDGECDGDTSMTPGGIELEFRAAIEACEELGEEDDEDDEDEEDTEEDEDA